LHPTSVKENYLDELAHVKEWIYKRNFYAIGEIGIDLYWDKTFLKQQQEAFRTQIIWAKEKKIPIVIHCRDAFDEIFEILEAEKSKDLRGIFHCFTGTKEQALQAISYNMKLGIGGVVTFKNGKIDTFLNEIDIAHIVLETDAPYLAPAPYRGKRNESSYITNVVDKLVDIYRLSFKEISEITTQNSKDVFNI
jgi:TatD DNase family protein